VALIEKPDAQVKREKAQARVEMRQRERAPWAKPVIAQGEEIPVLESTALGPRMAAGIRWAIDNQYDEDRVRAALVCHQCLTPFPAPASLKYIATWRALDSDQWNWAGPDMRDAGLALIARGCCPVCGYEQSPEMLALQEMAAGPSDNDQDWKNYVDGFDQRAEDYFERTERQRSGRTTGYKPRGGFLSHRPIRSVFDKARGG